MSTQKKPLAIAVGLVFLFVIIFLVRGCFALFNQNTAQQADLKPPPLESKYESTWRDVTDGDEAIKIGKSLIKNNITCPILKVRQSNDNNGSYLCACQQDVGQSWTIYQVWPELGSIQVAYEHVKEPQAK